MARARPEEPEAERQAFQQGMKALEDVLGVRPAGYRAPAWDLTPITLDLVRFIKGHDGVWWPRGREVTEHWFARP